MLHEPDLKVRVIEFRVWFVNVSGQIEVLRCYKALHDELHLLEYHCYNFVIQEVRRVADLRRRLLADQPNPAPTVLVAKLRDCVRWELIDQPEIELRAVIYRLHQTEASRQLPRSETAWVKELGPALDGLSAALNDRDVSRLEWVGGALSRVIRLRPFQVNSRLFRAAIDLHLESLIEALEQIQALLARAGVKAARLGPLRAGQTALASLHHTLSRLVDEHNQWQDVDVELRQIEDNFRFDLTILEVFWPGVRQRVQALSGDDDEATARALREDTERLEKAVAEHNPARIERHFLRFRSQAANRFLNVDETLKTLCSELTKVADPVAAVLDAMEVGTS